MEVNIHNLSKLKNGSILEHKTQKNKDGTPKRCRISGKLKTWVTRPNEFSIPVKHGFYLSFYVTEKNASEWDIPGKDA